MAVARCRLIGRCSLDWEVTWPRAGLKAAQTATPTLQGKLRQRENPAGKLSTSVQPRAKPTVSLGLCPPRGGGDPSSMQKGSSAPQECPDRPHPMADSPEPGSMGA